MAASAKLLTIGEVARRYGSGRLVLRLLGAAFVVVGVLFLLGVM